MKESCTIVQKGHVLPVRAWEEEITVQNMVNLGHE